MMDWRELNEADVRFVLGSCDELRLPDDESKPLVVVVDQTVTMGALKGLQRLIGAKTYSVSPPCGLGYKDEGTLTISFEFGATDR